ncbi:uncharacterized protein A4U43_C07F13980 [Asparagus officinalis]|uniref:RRM domain-containing protein n=1 Tax=Asparagus officinalis TaxID=4686 RepID=A0A5P1EBZ3_ASPOF|nr:uncharacterized protein A4U43_C07F13980 [Asparagus officinalis]
MGRYHSRSPSYSPPRRKRYDDPRDPTAPPPPPASSPEDLRVPFERFGPVKDVYLPKNYYTGEPRGFGFVKFRYPDDAAEAKEHMNHQVIGGREISIVFAEENRKTPQEMRTTARVSDRYMGGSSRRRSPRRQYHSYSRSPSPPPRRDLRDRYGSRYDDDYYSPRRSISPSPRDRNYRSYSRSPSPERTGRSPSRSHSYRSNRRSPSPEGNG